MATNPDIQIASRMLLHNRTRYTVAERYYAGSHDLAFATDKFKNAFGKLFREFALNLCPAVVDALRDKLIVKGFGVETGSPDISEQAWEIWQRNRMGKRSGEIHKEAVKAGDAYAIVWPDATGKATIYPHLAGTCMVRYDEETPGRVLWAAKYWETADLRPRLNLFYPDRVEKYIGVAKRRDPTDARQNPETHQYKEFDGDGPPVIPNPYGTVPVFHFANNADIGLLGDSELVSAIPVQNALNKSVLDMLVAMEFSAFRQRWISGIELEYDEAGAPIAPFRSGAERIWVTESAETKFGDFAATDLTQFLEVKESFTIDMARVTGTPLYYFIQLGGTHPSGESLKKSESRFINKVRDRMEGFGNAWEDLMRFALMIDNKGKDVRLFTEWEDPSPLSEKEEMEILLMKQDLGVSMEKLLEEAGYGESDIRQMVAAKQAEREAMVRSFNRGEVGDEPEAAEENEGDEEQ